MSTTPEKKRKGDDINKNAKRLKTDKEPEQEHKNTDEQENEQGDEQENEQEKEQEKVVPSTQKKWKVLFLCAGYGTRLNKDVESLPEYNHLRNIPKGLAPIGDRPLLSYWIDYLAETASKTNISLTEDVSIITNHLFYPLFLKWAENDGRGISPNQILDDGCTTNARGSVGSLQHALKHFDLRNSNLVVIASDTLFLEFDMPAFLDECAKVDGSLITFYNLRPDQTTLRTGILETDEATNKLEAFLEKPHPSTTLSRKACPCFYYFDPKALSFVDEFLSQKTSENFNAFDAPGNFIRFLIEKHNVYVTSVDGKYVEVGDLETYLEADKRVKDLQNKTQIK